MQWSALIQRPTVCCVVPVAHTHTHSICRRVADTFFCCFGNFSLPEKEIKRRRMPLHKQMNQCVYAAAEAK